MSYPHNQPVPSPRPAEAVSDRDRPQPPNGVIFSTATRAAATYTSDPIHNAQARGVRLYCLIGDDGAAGTVTAEIQTKDPVTDTWLRIPGAVTAALVTSATPQALTVYPGITTAANVDVNNVLGAEWRVVAVVAANDVAFSIGAVYLI